MLTANRRSVNERSLTLSVSHDVRQSKDVARRGGDFFAFVQQGDGCLTIAVGDASTKEAEGSYHAHVLKRAFRRAALEHAQPRKILDVMSFVFLETTQLRPPAEKFACVFVGHIDTKRRRLVYSSAGAEGGLLFRCLTAHEHLVATGPLLGIERRPLYGERSMELDPGNIIVAYTDGVTEARSANDARVLGTHGLAKLVRNAIQASLAPGYGNVLGYLDRFSGGLYNDDATLVCVTAAES